jgi:hypothetical protein
VVWNNFIVDENLPLMKMLPALGLVLALCPTLGLGHAPLKLAGRRFSSAAADRVPPRPPAGAAEPSRFCTCPADQAVCTAANLVASGSASPGKVDELCLLDSAGAVQADLVVEFNFGLVRVDLSAVRSSAGSITFMNNAALASVDLSGLTTVADFVQIRNNQALAALKLSALRSVGGYVSIQTNVQLESLQLSALVSTGDFIQIRTNAALEILDLSALASTGGSLVIRDNSALTISRTMLQQPVDVDAGPLSPTRPNGAAARRHRPVVLANASWDDSLPGVTPLKLDDLDPAPTVQREPVFGVNVTRGVHYALTLATAAAASPSVHKEAVYAVNITKGVPYGEALLCDGGNFSQRNCTAIELLLDVLRPVANGSTSLPTRPMPVMLGVHGGSYSHGDSSMEYANVQVARILPPLPPPLPLLLDTDSLAACSTLWRAAGWASASTTACATRRPTCRRAASAPARAATSSAPSSAASPRAAPSATAAARLP